jgi:hypothetical protein
MAYWTLFAGVDLFGEFDTRQDAEQALDDAIEADPSAADELVVFELDENGERVGEPITRAAALAATAYLLRVPRHEPE